MSTQVPQLHLFAKDSFILVCGDLSLSTWCEAGEKLLPSDNAQLHNSAISLKSGSSPHGERWSYMKSDGPWGDRGSGGYTDSQARPGQVTRPVSQALLNSTGNWPVGGHLWFEVTSLCINM